MKKYKKKYWYIITRGKGKGLNDGSAALLLTEQMVEITSRNKIGFYCHFKYTAFSRLKNWTPLAIPVKSPARSKGRVERTTYALLRRALNHVRTYIKNTVFFSTTAPSAFICNWFVLLENFSTRKTQIIKLRLNSLIFIFA